MKVPVFTFLGNPALVRNEADRMISEKSPERDSLCFQRIAIEDAFVLLPQELMSFSMFASSRVFLVTKLEEASVELLEFLLSYVTNDAEGSIHTLILTGSTLPKKGPVKKLKEALEKQGTLLECTQIKPAEYLNQLCADQALQLSHKAKAIVLQRVGSDLLSLENEVAKLSCFSSGKQLEDHDIEELTATISEVSMWDLTDALIFKDTGKAMNLLYQMLDKGQAPHYILATISGQVRRLLELQESIQRKKAIPTSWVRVPERKRQNVIRVLQQYPLVPRDIFSQLQKSNRLFNSAKAGDRHVLELLVLELCTQL